MNKDQTNWSFLIETYRLLNQNSAPKVLLFHFPADVKEQNLVSLRHLVPKEPILHEDAVA